MSFKTRLAWRARQVRSPEYTAFTVWLRHRGSLTARLQARGTFAVHLLRQSLARPTLDEAVSLGIKPSQLAWIREVVLLCDGQPVVFAHTVLPYRPRGALTRWFARLGNRSLGAVLFSHHGFSRGALKSKRIDHRHALFAPAIAAMQLQTAAPPTLWARRSLFVFRSQSVLVSEVFSPVLGDDPARR